MRTSLSIRVGRRIVVGFVALLLTAGVAASQQDHRCQGGHNCNTGSDPVPGGDSNADATSNLEAVLQNDNTVVTVSKSEGGSAESTIEDGAVRADGGEGGDGGNSSVGAITIEAARQRGTVTIKNTPTALAPNIYASGPCFKGSSGAASGPGFGLSIGGGRIDPGCVEREEIRIAAQIGLMDRAIYRWCGLENNVKEFGSRDDCLSYPPVEVEYGVTSDPKPPIQMLLADVTEEEYVKQVEETEAVQVRQQVTISALMDRLLKAEFEEEERKAADQRRAQSIEEYKAKWAVPKPVDGG